MDKMPRKNLHLPDDVVRLIGDVLHKSRFRSETQAVISMLEGASDRLEGVSGYVYLMRGQKGLKIGTSVQPHKRSKALKSGLLHCITGDRLTELAVHMIWGRYRISAREEWFSDIPEIVNWFENHDLAVAICDVVDGASGRPLRDRPVPVAVSEGEHKLIENAAAQMGVGVSTYMRLKALEAARG